MKELGYENVESDKLKFKEATLVNHDEITDKLFEGEDGAGEYHFWVTIVAESEWNDIITGEMRFAIHLNYAYGDLGKYNNFKFESDEPFFKYTEIAEELKVLISKANFAGKQTALYFIRWKGFEKVLNMSELFDAETNKEFTQSDFEQMKSKQTKKFYVSINPTEYGKEAGLINEAEKVFLEFTKE